ncbi:RNase H family protein [Clostridium sp. 'White wine YQ']|uniref:RNase H family protein n=1 Tax=Clostridium sp. 'White wine YQ' TaxID=3027474 RepID=UPI0023652D00|nr:RNase H family protein [Clostridium sp. 'White wine YQ']MDD7796312.1 reverse transcriptase-like protein [Clostridium sp. 'White wine YQ']
MNINIYSDGCCINNGLENAVASWSYVAVDENREIIRTSVGKVEGAQNNNRAELTAFINALQYVRNERNESFTIHVDYEALYLYCNGKARPKSNLDLYRQINYLMNMCGDRITVEKVKAHKTRDSFSNFINGVVDTLAKKFLEFIANEDFKG